MGFIRIAYISFLMITLLMIHKSMGKENCTSVKEVKTQLFLKLAEEMIAKARENMPSDSNNKQPNIIKKARDCKELQQLGDSNSGVYTIWLRTQDFGEKSLNVYCDMETDGGGWTVIQRRGNYSTPADYFNKSWSSYKEGFGDIKEEFWLGNENLFDLTNQKVYSVRFDLHSFDGKKGYAEYISFFIDGEGRNYMVHIKNYTGNAGDAMSSHDGQQFSTPDRDNDSSNTRHCAKDFWAGWWYKSCYESNLNGKRGQNDSTMNVRWIPFNDNKGLHTVEIKIRPRA